MLEVLAGEALGGEGGVAPDPGGAVVAAPRVGAQVPVFGQDGNADGRRLPLAYRDVVEVVEVVADAGQPLRAGRCARRWGLGPSRRVGKGCG